MTGRPQRRKRKRPDRSPIGPGGGTACAPPTDQSTFCPAINTDPLTPTAGEVAGGTPAGPFQPRFHRREGRAKGPVFPQPACVADLRHPPLSSNGNIHPADSPSAGGMKAPPLPCS